MLIGHFNQTGKHVAGKTAGAILTLLALIVYVSGFLAAGLAAPDALGAATAHVLPGALAGYLAWRIQPTIQKRPILVSSIAHGFLAPMTGALWIVLTLGFTRLARPDIYAEVAPAATPGILASGIALYLAAAVIFSALDSRRRVAMRDVALAQAQLAEMRARVEPHFLFNTLETISALVRERPDAAEDAIARLGRMMRHLIEKPRGSASTDLVTVREELALVRDYLSIARLRMGDRLVVIEKIMPDVLECAVPPFVLQTLAENAIIHGLDPKPTGGTLSIVATRENGQLVLIIADDGIGAEESELEAGGHGLQLVRKRLKAQYQGHASVSVAAHPGRGVSIRLSLPAVLVD